MLPSYNLDTKLIAPVKVKYSFRVLWFLYELNVCYCATRLEGCSIKTSVASITCCLVFTKRSRCHSGFVLMRKCSGGIYSLADTFPRNISASVNVPPRIFLHARKCSASVNERVQSKSDDIIEPL